MGYSACSSIRNSCMNDGILYPFLITLQVEYPGLDRKAPLESKGSVSTIHSEYYFEVSKAFLTDIPSNSPTGFPGVITAWLSCRTNVAVTLEAAVGMAQRGSRDSRGRNKATMFLTLAVKHRHLGVARGCIRQTLMMRYKYVIQTTIECYCQVWCKLPF